MANISCTPKDTFTQFMCAFIQRDVPVPAVGLSISHVLTWYWNVLVLKTVVREPCQPRIVYEVFRGYVYTIQYKLRAYPGRRLVSVAAFVSDSAVFRDRLCSGRSVMETVLRTLTFPVCGGKAMPFPQPSFLPRHCCTVISGRF